MIKLRHCSHALSHALLSMPRLPPMVRTAPDALLTAIRSKDRATISDMIRKDPSLVMTRAPGGESLVLHACYMEAPELADLLHTGRAIDAGEAAALGDVITLRTCLGLG